MKMRAWWMTAAVAGLMLAGSGAVAAVAATSQAGTRPTALRPAAGPVPAGFQPDSVTFVSASLGWVLGTAPCSHKPCTSIVRTTDGGRRWVGIPAPKLALASFAGTRGLDRLRFADASDGFAFGSQLWATHNGGASWHRVTQVPGYITDLEASAGIVYAASEKSGHLTIYRSPAGIDGWQRVSGLPAVADVDGGLGTITLHGTAAWIILGNRLHSSQGGASWRTDGVRCPSGWGMDSVAAYSLSRITLLCSGDPGLGQTRKTLYASADGGVHFSRVGSLPTGGDGGLLAEATPQRLFVVSASGASWIYESSNGGRHWRAGLTLDDGGKGWNDFGFTTATQGVAVEGTPAEGSHLYLTRDAGRHWSRVRF
jgi:photosystem II stability/assembly factor-like uncharacterized protein